MSVSEEFKILSKKVKKQNVKLTIVNNSETTKSIRMMQADIYNAMPSSRLKARNEIISKKLVYRFEGQLFKTIMQQIDITLKNAEAIENNTIQFEYGILINGAFEYVDMGEFFVPAKDIDNDKNKEELVVTGYDKMHKFMKTFKQSELGLVYPCKMLKFVEKMAEVCGVGMYSTDFFNADLMVDEDFFSGQDLTYRDILDKVAQATLTTIFIKENKLYLCKVGENEQVLDTSYLSNLVINEKFGPLNSLILGRGVVEDNIEACDQDSINANGLHELRFDENEFLDSKREQVINAMFEQIKGLEYYAFEAKNIGLMWLKPCDLLILKGRDGKEYKSFYLKANVTITLGIQGDMGADIPEETSTEYKVTTAEEKRALRTERLAKKNEGIIKDIVEQQTETSQKLAQQQIDIDGIKQSVEDIEDVTNEVEGNKTINLGNCVAGSLLELHIYGNNEVFDYLYPADNLYPSNDLYPYGDSRIVVTNKDGVDTIYELGVGDVLRQNGNVCDEYILKNGQAKVIRRINTDGSIKQTEVVENLGEYKILLENGTNTITIENYTAKLKAKFVIKNSYTDIYASKVEMNSAISSTAKSIDLNVNQKLSNYSNTTEMNAAISAKADEISSEVSKKVGEDELGTKMIQNYESIKFAWNKISQFLKMEGIEGKVSLNIYDSNNKKLMSLDQNGQEFYGNSGNKIGTIGVIRENELDTLAFAMNVDWDKVTQSKSMAWGFFDKNGNFLPVFHLLGVYGIDNSEYRGELAVEGDLSAETLKVIKNTVESGDASINICDSNGNILFSADSSTPNFNLGNILYTFKAQNGNIVVCCDYFQALNVPNTDNISMISGSGGDNGFIHANFNDGTYARVYVNNSDKQLKKNIKTTINSGIEKIKKINHVEFDWKKTKEHQDIGYIAQEMKNIDESFVHYTKIKDQDGKEKENWQINVLSVLATATKAIQEQQLQIEKLTKKVEMLERKMNNEEI